MPIIPILLFHIVTAVIALMSGYAAMFLRKGSRWHGATGTTFVVSMIAMATSGAYISIFIRPIAANVVVAMLTCYLVTTSWWAARKRAGGTGMFDVIALVFILIVGVTGVAWGLEAANSPGGTKDRMPAGLYFFFGSASLLCAALDVRMLVRRGYTGTQRLVRHLSRMCFALLIATFSFYPGQAKLFPQWLRATNLLVIPHLLLLGTLIFWAVRMAKQKRVQRQEPRVLAQRPAIVTTVA